ncbi:hypothetical protein QBC45DRAFT_396758 [Copromyces sp. CBS 386.78]|nr:hypothetical protein QBC45DRAFT_396758 [Copromyces sp. CBS 386.78]
MADNESAAHLRDNERYSKTLDAIVSAPSLSIRAVLFSLYAEGTDEVKSLIEDRVSDFTAVANLRTVQLQNPSATTMTTNRESSDERSEENLLKRKATDEEEEQPEKKLAYCIHCEEEFDPEDETDDGYYCINYHPGDMELNRYSHDWRGFACIDPWETGSGSEYELDAEEWRLSCPGGFTWDCCGRSGGTPGCERRSHEAEESDEDNADDEMDESD